MKRRGPHHVFALLPSVLCCHAAPAQDAPEDLTLRIGGGFQFRYIATAAPGADSPGDEEAIGFEFRRLRSEFEFKPPDSNLTLYLRVQAEGGQGEMLDAWLGWSTDEQTRIRVGQFQFAHNREQAVSAWRQLAVDRSAVANRVNPGVSGRVQGIEYRRTSGTSRIYLSANEGLEVESTPFNDDRAAWGLSGRYERLLIGESFKQFDQFTAPPGTPRGVMLGVSAHAQGADDLGDRAAFSADLSYQQNGFNAMIMGEAAVAEDRNQGAMPEPESVYGVVAHAGLYVSETVEPFVRGEWATVSGADHPGLSIITAGVNWYIIGHALKLTADASVAIDGVGPAFNRRADGLLPTPDGENRFIFRAQMQLLF